MFAPTKYLEDVISSQLEAFIENFDMSDQKGLSIGLWSGQIKLNNLKLKRQVIPMGFRTNLILEPSSSISSLDLSIPWTSLASGKVSAIISDLQVVLRVSELNLLDPNDHAEFLKRRAEAIDSKIKNVNSEILKVLSGLDADTTTDHTKIKSGVMNLIASSLISRILSGFTLEINNVTISFSVPSSSEYGKGAPEKVFAPNRWSKISSRTLMSSLEHHGDSKEDTTSQKRPHSRVIVTMKSVLIERGDMEAKSRPHTSSKVHKNIDVRGFTLNVKHDEDIYDPVADSKSYSRWRSLGTERNVPLLLGPLNVSTNVHVYEDTSEWAKTKNSSFYIINSDINIVGSDEAGDGYSEKREKDDNGEEVEDTEAEMHTKNVNLIKLSVTPHHINVLHGAVGFFTLDAKRTALSDLIPSTYVNNHWKSRVWYALKVKRRQLYENRSVVGNTYVRQALIAEYGKYLRRLLSKDRREFINRMNENYDIQVETKPKILGLDLYYTSSKDIERITKLQHLLTVEEMVQCVKSELQNPNNLDMVLDKQKELKMELGEKYVLIEAKSEIKDLKEELALLRAQRLDIETSDPEEPLPDEIVDRISEIDDILVAYKNASHERASNLLKAMKRALGDEFVESALGKSDEVKFEKLTFIEKKEGEIGKLENIDSDTFDFPLHADDRLTRIDYQLSVNIGGVIATTSCATDAIDVKNDNCNVSVVFSGLDIGVIINDDGTIGADVSLNSISARYQNPFVKNVELFTIGTHVNLQKEFIGNEDNNDLPSALQCSIQVLPTSSYQYIERSHIIVEGTLGKACININCEIVKNLACFARDFIEGLAEAVDVPVLMQPEPRRFETEIGVYSKYILHKFSKLSGFENAPRLSLDVCTNVIVVSVAIHESNHIEWKEHLLLKVDSLSYKSGDFISMVSAYHSADDEPRSRPSSPIGTPPRRLSFDDGKLWQSGISYQNCEHQIKDFFQLTRDHPVTNSQINIRGIDVLLRPPHHVSSNGHIVRTSESSHSPIHLLTDDWNIYLAITMSAFSCTSGSVIDINGERAMDEISMKCICSPLLLAATTSDVFHATDSVLKVIDTFTLVTQLISQPNSIKSSLENDTEVEPRPMLFVKDIASLSKFRLSLHIDHVNLVLLAPSDPLDIDEVLSEIFHTYAVAKVCKEDIEQGYKITKIIAIERLSKILHIKHKAANRILKDFFSRLPPNFNMDDVEDDARGALSAAKQQALEDCHASVRSKGEHLERKWRHGFWTANTSRISTHAMQRDNKESVPILSIDIKSLNFQLHSMTYDTSMEISLEDLVVADQQFYPIIHICNHPVKYFTDPGNFERDLQLSPDKRKSRVEANALKVKIVTSTSDTLEIGSLTALRNLPDDTVGERHISTHFHINVAHINSIISSPCVEHVFNCVIETMQRCGNLLRPSHDDDSPIISEDTTQKRMTKPSSYKVVSKIFINADVKTLGVVLVHHRDSDEYFIEMELSGASVALSDEEIHAKLVDINIYDISRSHIVHRCILWKMSMEEKPAYAVEVKLKGMNTLHQTLQIDVANLSLCMLMRVVTEITDFVYDVIGVVSVKIKDMQNVTNRKEVSRRGSAHEMEKIFTSPRDLKKSDVVQPSVMMKDDMKSQFIRPRSSILDMPYIDPGIYEHTDDESSVCSSFFSNDGEEVHTEPQVRRNSSHESTFIPEKKDQPVGTFKWTVNLKNFTCFLPRNSHSHDVVAVTANSAMVTALMVATKFPVPTSARRFVDDYGCENDYSYVDPYTNEWKFKNIRHDNIPYSSRESMSSIGLPSNPSKECIDDETASTCSFKSANTHISECPVNYNDQKSPLEEGNVFRILIELHSADIFASLEPNHFELRRNYPKPKYSPFHEVTNHGPVYKKPISSTKRGDNRTPMHMFASPSSDHANTPFSSISTSPQRTVIGTESPRQIWRKVTCVHHSRELSNNLEEIVSDNTEQQTSFDLNCMLDFEEAMSIFIADAPEVTPLNLHVTMAEMMLLESIYFDNMQELSQFKKDSSQGEIITEKKDVEYKSKEYNDLFKMSHVLPGCFAMMMREVRIFCAMDKGYLRNGVYRSFLGAFVFFHRHEQEIGMSSTPDDQESPVDPCADEEHSATHNAWIDFANLKIMNLLVHSEWGSTNGVSRTMVGASKLSIMDFTGAVLLSVGENNKFSSYTHRDFGIGYSPHTPRDMKLDLPFVLSMHSLTRCAVTSCNIGVASPIVQAESLEQIMQIVQFFASYFSNPIFGNPVAIANSTSKHDPLLDAYTSMDVQVFLCSLLGVDDEGELPEDLRATPTKYHYPTALIDEELYDDLTSNTLMLVMKDGLYFQYWFDSIGCVRMTCDILDIKAIRRVKGARSLDDKMPGGFSYLSESELIPYVMEMDYNEGDHVLIDSLSVYYSNFYDPTDDYQNVSDTRISLASSQNSTSICHRHEPDFVDVYCVAHVVDSSRANNARFCSLLFSVDDIQWASNVVTHFLGFDIESPPTIPTSSTTIEKPLRSTMVIQANYLEVTLVDHGLGLHLPLLKLSIKRLNLTHKTGGDSTPSELALDNVEYDRANALAQSFLIKLDVYSDFFNTKLKCWEPLLEPITLQATFERSLTRGMGCVVRMETDLHLNFSDSLVPVIMHLQKIFWSGDDTRSKKSDSPSNVHVQGKSTHASSHRFVAFSQHGSSRYPSSYRRSRSTDTHRQQTTSLTNIGRTLSHNFSNIISFKKKAAFSVVNMLGQPVRYIHGNMRDKNITFNYINHNERGLLDFHPTITYLHNCEVVEVPFNRTELTDDSADIQRLGKHHSISLQVCGYAWLTDDSDRGERRGKDNRVQADVFGIQYHTLHSLFENTQYNQLLKHYLLKNAVKMVSEVSTHSGGGKVLTLRSVFAIRNNTAHKLRVVLKCRELLRLSDDDDDKDGVVIDSGGTYHIPLSLLLQGGSFSDRVSLGYVWLRPADIDEVKEYVTNQDDVLHSIRHSTVPIDLSKIIQNTHEIFNKYCEEHPNKNAITGGKSLFTKFPLSCDVRNINKKIKNRSFDNLSEAVNNDGMSQDSIQEDAFEETKTKLTYNIEVKRSALKKMVYPGDRQRNKEGILDSYFDFMFTNKRQYYHGPCTYDLTVHPPFIIENLLPMAGEFDLFNPISKIVLWSGFLIPGEAKSVYTLDQGSPIALAINLYNCSTPQGGVLVHYPIKWSNYDNAFDTLLSFVKDMSFSTSTLQSSSKTTAILADEFNQQMKVDIENNVGNGGDRHIVISVPFWVVNTSQYAIRMAQEGVYRLPTGTVSALMDGSKCQDRVRKSERWQTYLRDNSIDNKIFLGKRSKFHHKSKEALVDSEHSLLWGDIPFEKLVDMAAMFNYEDDAIMNVVTSTLTFGKRVSIKLDESEWSYPFSLEFPGVHQTISVFHNATYDRSVPDGGVHEISYIVNAAEGRLGKYTRIVRFSPHLILVNNLPVPIKISSPSGFFDLNDSSINVKDHHTKPFHLPLQFGGRKIQIDVYGSFEPTPDFGLDNFGEYFLKLRRYGHFENERSLIRSKSYKLFPPRVSMTKSDNSEDRNEEEELDSQELGIWFETDWSHKNIVVKSVNKNRWAGSRRCGQTILPGDTLLDINGKLISEHYMYDPGPNPEDDNGAPRVNFDAVMDDIRRYFFGYVDVEDGNKPYLTFRTVEEVNRLIREKAKESRGRVDDAGFSSETKKMIEDYSNSIKDNLPIRLEILAIEGATIVKVSSFAMQISNKDEELKQSLVSSNAKHLTGLKVKNELVSHIIHFRQKNAKNSRWITLLPMSECVFMWDNPFHAKKALLLKVGRNKACLGSELDFLNFQTPRDEVVYESIDFEKIGHSTVIRVDQNDIDYNVYARIDSEGPSRVLLIHHADFDVSDPPVPLQEMMYVFGSEHIEKESSLEIEECEGVVQAQIAELSSLHEKIETLCNDCHLMQPNDQNIVGSRTRRRSSFTMGIEDSVVLSKIHNETSASLKKIKDKQVETIKELNQYDFDYTLLSNTEITSLTDIGVIHKVNQLSVEILEARELKSIWIEDVYCQAYLKSKDMDSANTLDLLSLSKVAKTSICEYTLEPKWIDEKHVFDILPHKNTLLLEDPLNHLKNTCTLRILIRSKVKMFPALKSRLSTKVGLDKCLGQVDIPFTCRGLFEQEVVEAWFPLVPRNSTIVFQGSKASDCGHIRLRLQWVHSDKGLLLAQKSAIENRLDTLREMKSNYLTLLEKKKDNMRWIGSKVMRKYRVDPESIDITMMNGIYNAHQNLMTMQRLRKQARIVRRGLNKGVQYGATGATSALSMGKGMTKTLFRAAVGGGSKSGVSKPTSLTDKNNLEEEQETVQYDILKSQYMENKGYGDDEDGDVDEKGNVEMEDGGDVLMREHTNLLARIKHSQLEYPYSSAWNAIKKSKDAFEAHLAKKTSDSTSRHLLSRDKAFARYVEKFDREFHRSCDRSYNIAHAKEGIIDVEALEVMNISVGAPVFIRVSYHIHEYSTFSIPPATKLEWKEDDYRKQTGMRVRDAWKLKKSISIDTSNIQGPIRVSVMEEGLMFHEELAYVDLPCLKVIGNVSVSDGAYDRYFPLTMANNINNSFISSFSKKRRDPLRLGDENTHEQVAPEDFGEFHSVPYIRLKLGWTSVSTYGGNTSSATSFDIVEKTETDQYYHCILRNVSISLIYSDFRQEILELSLSNIDGRVVVNKSDSNAYLLDVASIQIDNRLQFASEPVILSQRPQKVMPHILRACVIQNNKTSKANEIICFDRIEGVLQELNLHLEQQTVVAVIKLYERLSDLISSSEHGLNRFDEFTCALHKLGFQGLKTSPTKEYSHDEFDEGLKIYIAKIMLHTIKIRVSFLTTSSDVIDSLGEDIDVNNYMQGSGNNGRLLYTSVSAFVNRVGEVVLGLTTSITDAPIRFTGKQIDNFDCYQKMLGIKLIGVLQTHYLSSAWWQLLNVIGSLDLVGNPLGLASSLGSGVRDLFYEPANAIINQKGTSYITWTIFEGFANLIRNTADSTLGTANNMTNLVGKGVAALSLDSVFIKNREGLKRTPRDMYNFIARPFSDVLNGVYCGVVGIVRVPYHHVIKRGWRDGLITGVPAGLVGVLSKPAVGALDAVGHLGGTIQELANYMGSDMALPTQRRRYSSIFGPDKRLLPYSTYTSLGYHAIVKASIVRLDAASGLRSVANEVFEMSEMSGNFVGEIVNMLNTNRAEDIQQSNDPGDDVERPVSMIEDVTVRVTPLPNKITDECVVSAAYFDRNIPHTFNNQLVVITTKKISYIACEYNDAVIDGFVEFKLSWEIEHEKIVSIKYEKTSGEQYIKIKLTENPHDDDDSDKVIRSSSCREDTVLKRIHNVLQSLKGNFDELLEYDEVEDEWWGAAMSSSVRISNFYFSKHSPSRKKKGHADKKQVNADVLNAERWYSKNKRSKMKIAPKDNQRPKWLVEYEKQVLKCHESSDFLRSDNVSRGVTFESSGNDSSFRRVSEADGAEDAEERDTVSPLPPSVSGEDAQRKPTKKKKQTSFALEGDRIDSISSYEDVRHLARSCKEEGIRHMSEEFLKRRKEYDVMFQERSSDGSETKYARLERVPPLITNKPHPNLEFLFGRIENEEEHFYVHTTATTMDGNDDDDDGGVSNTIEKQFRRKSSISSSSTRRPMSPTAATQTALIKSSSSSLSSLQSKGTDETESSTNNISDDGNGIKSVKKKKNPLLALAKAHSSSLFSMDEDSKMGDLNTRRIQDGRGVFAMKREEPPMIHAFVKKQSE